MNHGCFYSVIRVICMPFLKILFPFHVNGKNNLPMDGRIIICCNHMSIVDPAFLVISQKRRICFMAKSELFENRFLSWFFSALGAFPVHRGAGDSKAIIKSEHILEEGGALGIFIEGTRSRDGELLRPRSGAAMIAYHSNAAVLPACISCKKGGMIRLFKRMVVSFGEPLTLEQLGLVNGTKAEVREATKMIMEKIKEMRQRDTEVSV